jgi:hypothetical protein
LGHNLDPAGKTNDDVRGVLPVSQAAVADDSGGSIG